MVKYRTAHSQKAGAVWMNLSQWMIVAMPSSEANVATGGKPPLTVCQARDNPTRAKK